MKRIFLFSYGHPFLVLAATVLFTAAVAVFALRVRVDVSHDTLIPLNSAKLAGYNDARKTFGSDVIAAVFVRDPRLFTAAKLKQLREIHDQLAQLGGVEKTESLFTINNIRNDNGAIDTSPLLDTVPEDEEKLLQKKKNALDNPLIRGRLLSMDGQATVITLYLNQERANLRFNSTIHAAIEEILKPHANQFCELFQVGSPFIETSMANYLWHDQVYLLPISCLILILFIGYSLNSYSSAIVPLSNAIVSTIWTAAAMYALDLPVNFLTYMIPAMMIVIGSLEDIHMIASFQEARKETGEGKQAMGLVGQRLGVIFLCTSSTTVIGFGANAVSDLPIMISFGIASAIAMTFNFLATILMAPAAIRLLGGWMIPKAQPHDGGEPGLMARLSSQTARFVLRRLIRHPRNIYIGLAVCLAPSFYYLSKVELNNDLFSFFSQDSPIIQRNDQLHKHLAGVRTFYVQLLKDPGAFRASQHLKTAEAITAYLRKFEEFDSVTSYTDYLALVNREMNDGKERFHRVPDTDALADQYLLLFQRKDLDRYVAADYSSVNIIVRHNVNSSTLFNRLIARISDDLSSGRFGPLGLRITGKDVLIADGVDSVASGQVSSMSIDVTIIFSLMAVIFLSWRAGLLSMVPNVVPIVFIFGIMGWQRIPLNIGTSMVGAICIGIAVDDTIHFMLTYNQHLKQMGNETAALEETLQGETLPVLVSAFALAGGFFVLGFSSFIPVGQFGVLSGICMLLGVATDMVLTPILLTSCRLITLWETVGLKLQEKVLGASLLFKGMRKWQIRRLVLMSDLIEFPPEYRVITEGHEGECMFIVLEGKLTVFKNVNGREEKISTLRPGDLFGEIALICAEKRTASVVSDTWVKLLTVDWNALEKMRRWSPFIASAFFLNVARILGTRLVRQVNISSGIEYLSEARR